jgi:hypothetical protein
MHDKWMLTSKDMEGRSFNLTEISPHLPIKSEESQKNPLESPRVDWNSNTEFMECRSRVYLENHAPLGYYAANSGNSLLTFRYNLSVPLLSKFIRCYCCIYLLGFLLLPYSTPNYTCPKSVSICPKFRSIIYLRLYFKCDPRTFLMVLKICTLPRRTVFLVRYDKYSGCR